MPNLVQEIKALLKKGDDAVDAHAEKFYKAAGARLIQLRKDKTKAAFEKIVRKQCDIGISWAYVLMRIAEGKTTLKKERAKAVKSMGKSRAKKRPERSGQKRELAPEDLPGDTPEQQWQYSLGNMAGDAISLLSFWGKTFGEEWREFNVSSDLVTLARQAAEAWTQIADELTTRAGAIPIRRTSHGS